MLKRFRVSNFRNLINIEFRPAGLNLLIGPNNAGKTNLCLAIRFLSLTAAYGLDTALRIIGGPWNILNAYTTDSTVVMEVEATLPHQDEQIEFSYRLEIAARPGSVQTTGQLFDVVNEVLTVEGGEFGGMPLLQNECGKVILLDEGRTRQEREKQYVKATAPTDNTMLYLLYDVETNRGANLFKRYLQSWAYFNFSSQSLRSPVVEREPIGLFADGKNFSQVLFTLHNLDPAIEGKIIKLARELEPKLRHLVYSFPDPEQIYLSIEDDERKRFGVNSISDGTLRFMALAYLVFDAAKSVENGVASPLFFIEEPENGLFVGHLKPLLQRIDPTGKAGQFVFTTHSPYFIDLFDSNPEGLHLLKPGKPSCSLTKPDPDRIRKLLEDMPLGELHFREMLG